MPTRRAVLNSSLQLDADQKSARWRYLHVLWVSPGGKIVRAGLEKYGRRGDYIGPYKIM
jgi:hypothetical protein